MIGARYCHAMRMAVAAHSGQNRKTTPIPYISHPIAVSALVLEHGGDEDQACIALLHDAIEDCGAHYESIIRGELGNRVADGVMGCSDCSPDTGAPKAPWRDRKVAYISHLDTASDDVLLVSACDKLHNAGCIVRDLERDGVAVFDRFKGGKNGTLWYYSELSKAFHRRLSASRPDLVAALQAMVFRMAALAD